MAPAPTPAPFFPVAQGPVAAPGPGKIFRGHVFLNLLLFSLAFVFEATTFSGKATLSASSVYNNDRNRQPKNVMDKNIDTFYTSNLALDWLQINLGKEYIVTSLDVTKRRDYEKTFANIEVSLAIFIIQ